MIEVILIFALTVFNFSQIKINEKECIKNKYSTDHCKIVKAFNGEKK